MTTDANNPGDVEVEGENTEGQGLPVDHPPDGTPSSPAAPANNTEVENQPVVGVGLPQNVNQG